MQEKVKDILDNLGRVIVGKNEALELTVVTLLAEGHLLLEDIPGVGKTTLAKALAQTTHSSFGRIQFTPDTMPGDVTGASIYNMKEGTFQYVKGTIFHQMVLADEINRTSPKTQASLLEAMEERQVTVDGSTYELPSPFMVIATQNPMQYIGTYALPEAQLDRFFMKVSLGYPAREQENDMIQRFLYEERWKQVEPVVGPEDIIQMQKEVKQVEVHPDVIRYAEDLIQATRQHEMLQLGASPRAMLSFIRGAQAAAYVAGRNYVTPSDIKRLAIPMLHHRIVLSPEGRMAQMTTEKVIQSILTRVKVPVLP